MPVTILPNVPPEWDWWVASPYPREDVDIPAATDPAGTRRWQHSEIGLTEGIQLSGEPRRPITFRERTAGTAGLTDIVAPYRGIMCHQLAMTGATGQQSIYQSLNCQPVIDSADLAAGYTNPSWRRVYIYSAVMAIDAGTLDERTGFLMIPYGARQLVTSWPNGAAGNAGGFGLTCDGAGGWQWGIYDVGPFPGNVVEELPLVIADPEDWNLFELAVRSATPDRGASVALLVNGAQVLERNWVDAPAIPAAAAATIRYVPNYRMGTPSGDFFRVGGWESRNGRFLPDGQELLA